MLGLGEIDAAEIAFGEHDALGAQPAEIVVAEVVADEFAIGPIALRGATSSLPARIR